MLRLRVSYPGRPCVSPLPQPLGHQVKNLADARSPLSLILFCCLGSLNWRVHWCVIPLILISAFIIGYELLQNAQHLAIIAGVVSLQEWLGRPLFWFHLAFASLLRIPNPHEVLDGLGGCGFCRRGWNEINCSNERPHLTEPFSDTENLKCEKIQVLLN